MSTFIVGVDGSEGAHRAATFAAERAAAQGAKLVLVHVVEWSPHETYDVSQLVERHSEREKEIARAQKEILEPLLQELARDGLEIDSVVRHGHPAETLCTVAGEVGADQIFTGRRGCSKLEALLFGSVASSLVQI